LSRQNALSTAAGVLKFVDAGDAYAKFGAAQRGLRWTDARGLWEGDKPVASFVRYLKFAGPAADGITAWLDYSKAMKEADQGNFTAAYFDFAKAGLGVTAAGAGLYMAIVGFSGASGPFFPLVLLVTTVGYVAVSSAKDLFVDPNEIDFLKRAGFYQDGQFIPALGTGASGVAAHGGVRILDPGSSTLFKKGDVVYGLQVGIADTRKVPYYVRTPAELDELLTKTRQNALSIYDVMKTPAPK
jgi:hypothetical protein